MCFQQTNERLAGVDYEAIWLCEKRLNMQMKASKRINDRWMSMLSIQFQSMFSFRLSCFGWLTSSFFRLWNLSPHTFLLSSQLFSISFECFLASHRIMEIFLLSVRVCGFDSSVIIDSDWDCFYNGISMLIFSSKSQQCRMCFWLLLSWFHLHCDEEKTCRGKAENSNDFFMSHLCVLDVIAAFDEAFRNHSRVNFFITYELLIFCCFRNISIWNRDKILNC